MRIEGRRAEFPVFQAGTLLATDDGRMPLRGQTAMQRRTGVVTVDEFARLPDDDFRYELVSGVVYRMSPVGGLHGAVAARLVVALVEWADRHRAGTVMTETGFVLTTGPDTVLAPDISFVRRERTPANGLPTSFWRGAPDLAVEVLSPDDRVRDVGAKVREYLAHGVALVWVIDPATQTATVHSAAATVTLTRDQRLHGDVVLPGFDVPVSRLFPER
jgi:Uma2 family endonuclease